MLAHVADGQENPGHERRPIERVMPNGQGLPRTTEHNLLVSDQSPGAHGVHTYSVDDRSPGTIELMRRGIWLRIHPHAGLGDKSGRVHRRARWRIGLVRVMELDDLHRFKQRRGHRRELHHHHGPDTEIGCDKYADLRPSRTPASHDGESFVGEPGRAHHRMDTGLDGELQRRHDGIGSGEINDDLCVRVRNLRQGVTKVNGRNKLASEADCTAATTSAPILPRAPTTPTLIMAAA